MTYAFQKLVTFAVVAAVVILVEPLSLQWWIVEVLIGVCLFLAWLWLESPRLSMPKAVGFLGVGIIVLVLAIWLATSNGISLAEMRFNYQLPKIVRRLPTLATILMVVGSLSVLTVWLRERNAPPRID